MESTKARILCVEDHDDSRIVMKMLLEGAGYHVVAVTTCAEALLQVQQSEFDLHLIDKFLDDGELDDGEGDELCRQLVEMCPQVPVVFLSAAGEESCQTSALRAGARAYWVKPITIDTLAPQIEDILKREIAAGPS